MAGITPRKRKSLSNNSNAGEEDEDAVASDGSQGDESTTNQAGASSSMSNNKKQRRKRTVLSCTECKARKIKCDRNVPGCDSCVRRGIAHKCRWGDDRDDLSLQAIDPSQAALLSKIARLEALLKEQRDQEAVAAANGGNGASASPIVGSSNQNSHLHPIIVNGPVYDTTASMATPPSYRSSVASAPETSKYSHIPTSNYETSPRDGDDGESDGEDAMSGAEDAAQVLEQLARGMASSRKPGSRSQQRSHANGGPADSFSPAELPANGVGLMPFPIPSGVFASAFTQAPAIIARLPDPPQVRALAEWYKSEIDPMMICIHWPTFFRDLDTFNDALSAPARRESGPAVDLAFAALVFAMICGACVYKTPDEMVEAGFCDSPAAAVPTLEFYYSAANTLFSLADMGETPTMSGLQAVVLLCHYAFSHGRRTSYSSLVLMALRLSETLGIHRMGSAQDDEERWRAEDAERGTGDVKAGLTSDANHANAIRQDGSRSPQVARKEASDAAAQQPDVDNQLHGMFLPKATMAKREKGRSHYMDRNHALRENARCVWSSLCTLERFMSSHLATSSYVASADGVTTTLPLNLDDEMLPEQRNGPCDLQSQPAEIATAKSYLPILWSVGVCARSILDVMNRGEGYHAVLRIDRELRGILDSLPAFFRFDGHSEFLPAVREMHHRRPSLTFQRILVHEWVHHRLLSLHRLFMSRGHHNRKYQHALHSCIESSRTVIRMRRELRVFMDRGGGQGRANYGPLSLHLFQSAACLQMNLLQLSQMQVPWTPTMQDEQRDVDDAIDFLDARTRAQGDVVLAKGACEVLLHLREETLLRCQSSRAQGGTQGGLQPPAPYPASSALSHRILPGASHLPPYPTSNPTGDEKHVTQWQTQAQQRNQQAQGSNHSSPYDGAPLQQHPDEPFQVQRSAYPASYRAQNNRFAGGHEASAQTVQHGASSASATFTPGGPSSIPELDLEEYLRQVAGGSHAHGANDDTADDSFFHTLDALILQPGPGAPVAPGDPAGHAGATQMMLAQQQAQGSRNYTASPVSGGAASHQHGPPAGAGSPYARSRPGTNAAGFPSHLAVSHRTQQGWPSPPLLQAQHQQQQGHHQAQGHNHQQQQASHHPQQHHQHQQYNGQGPHNAGSVPVQSYLR